MTVSTDDFRWMAKALQLAEQGLWTTTPNPRVGCVIVKDGQLIGEGWHVRAGEPHAEVHALRAAGDCASGATAYVTLEPCSHHGRTPPCADALINAGISRVVAAMTDPDPRVAGKGLKRLAAAGIDVVCGVLESAAHELNIGFVSRLTRGRPWVRIKSAGSLDGRTALANGQSQWITSPEARLDGHRWRARACAILTGVQTVLTDDPKMTVRLPDSEQPTERQPDRIVLDSQLRLSPDAGILHPTPLLTHLSHRSKTWVITCIDAPDRAASLQAVGAEIIRLPSDAEGRVDLHAFMQWCGEQHINELHVEAGAKLNGNLLAQNLVDEILLYQAPCFLGTPAKGLFELPAFDALHDRIDLQIRDLRMIGPDIRLQLRPRHPAC